VTAKPTGPRPLSRAAVAMSRVLSRAWSLPAQRNYVALDRAVQVPMSDGTVLLADHYLPITGQPAATIVQVGPHDFGRTAYRNGVFDLYNFLSWSDLMANQERTGSLLGGYRMATAERRLRPVLDRMPVATAARSLLRASAPWFESWLEHPQLTDPFSAPLQCGAALDHLSVPTLLVGGRQDLFIEQTVEQYRALSARGVPVRLLVGPWAHMDATMRGGAPVVESLAWLDHYTDAKEAGTYGPVRIWVGAAKDAGGGRWRELPDWPPKEAAPQRWFLGPLGTLAQQLPANRTQTGFRYDPSDPTPAVGGATLSMSAGVREGVAARRRAPVRPRPPDQAAAGRGRAPALRPQPGQRAGGRVACGPQAHPLHREPRRRARLGPAAPG
jgi:predicted acyl esterase